MALTLSVKSYTFKTDVYDDGLDGSFNSLGYTWSTDSAIGNYSLLSTATIGPISLASAYSMGTSWSIACWIKPTAGGTTNYGTLCANSAGTIGFYYMGGSNKKINYLDGTNDNMNTDALTEGVWTHVGISYDSGSVIFYVNGIANGTATVATAAFSFSRMFKETAGDSYIGRLDDVRIYNKAMPASVFALLAAKTNYSPNLIHYYAFETGSGTIAFDTARGDENLYNNFIKTFSASTVQGLSAIPISNSSFRPIILYT